MPAVWRVAGFEELRELGAGAQGRVVLARHEESGTPVAIKYVSADAEQRELLRREAVLLGRVDDPHVARLYRLVESEYGAALVMEAIDGVSLKRVLEHHGALEPEAALLVMKGSLLGLAAAHRVGVVHRDYKPSNVVVRSDGLSKLIDFGIAVVAGQGGRSGTPAYMAPEQWRGEPAVPATDVYAATCVFFECLTGRRPFVGDSAEALREAHLHAPPPVEEAPEAVRSLLSRGMAKSAEERPGEVAEFVREVEAAASAAYGPDWESRAVRALAGAAAALASLFPLAALFSGGGSGGAAISGAAGAAGETAAAGGTGGAAASGGATAAAGAAGAKVGAGAAVAAGAVGVALVVGGGAAVVSGFDRDGASGRPTSSVRPVAATLVEQRQTFSERRLEIRAQYARLTGPADPAVRQRVDRALRAPLDWAIQIVDPQGSSQCTRNAVASLTARIGINGPSLLSVRYNNYSTHCAPSDGTYPGWTVTVDLKTGRTYTAEDILKPETLTRSGIRTLFSRTTLIEGEEPWGAVWGSQRCDEGYPDRSDFFPSRPPGYTTQFPPSLTVFLASDHIEVVTDRGGSDCVRERRTAPYAKVRDLLNPQILRHLPA